MSVSTHNPNPSIQTPSPFHRDMSHPSQPMAVLIQEPDMPTEETATIEPPAITTAPKDSPELTVEELNRRKEELERQIAERQQAEKDSVIQQIVDVPKPYSATIEDLIEAFGGFKPKRKGVKAVPKYRDPETGVTWSGRGKEPTWMRGQPRENFLIKDE